MKKILIILMIIGAFLRLYGLDKNPISLTVDEASIGYNAYSILKTGKDEWGQSFPLTFKSLGDYKPPFYIYLVVPSVAVFGLNEFAVRFPAALLGILSILLFYMFFLQLTSNKKYALAATILATFSPWHIYFSRMGSESMVAMVLVVAGIWSLMKSLEGKWYWAALSAVLLAISMYTYHAERLFLPMFGLVFIIFNKDRILKKRKETFIFMAVSILLLLPLAYSLVFGSDATRAQRTVITTDPIFLRYVLISPLGSVAGIWGDITEFFAGANFLVPFYFARRFLDYLNPAFLFFNGLFLTAPGTYGLGVMYLFELPFLIFGIANLIKKDIQNKYLIFSWMILGIVPAALTLSDQNAIRVLVVMPMLILISGIGAIELIRYVYENFGKMHRLIAFTVFSFFVMWNLSLGFMLYAIHFPLQRGEDFMEGTREIMQYIAANQDQYNEVVIDPVRGVIGPYIVGAPYVYLLFYTQYDPHTYQTEPKIESKDSYTFNKYTVRSITWIEDKDKEGTLFIGSPWSIPQGGLKEGEVLKKIYLSNGQLAFLIVSPKK